MITYELAAEFHYLPVLGCQRQPSKASTWSPVVEKKSQKKHKLKYQIWQAICVNKADKKHTLKHQIWKAICVNTADKTHAKTPDMRGDLCEQSRKHAR